MRLIKHTIIVAIVAVSFMMRPPAYALDIPDINGTDHLDMTKTVSMDFKNAQLKDVLKIFSQQSGLNFIAANDLANSTVDLYLENAPIDVALERILSANGLTYELKPSSNIFVVKRIVKPKVDLMTRVYQLKYITVPSSKLNEALRKFTTDETNTTSDEEEETKGIGIVAAVKAILTENGSVIEDTRTNSIVVTDIPGQFSVIEQTIARLDVRVPQILIEVEMLDISKTTADLLGGKFGDTALEFTGPAKDVLFPFNMQNAIDDADGGDGSGFTFAADPTYTVGTISFQNLTYTLQFLRTQTDTKNLARPRILTLNNETAEIQIKTDEAIGIAANTTSAEGTANSVEQAERVETGVFLKVTPQANTRSGEIIMAIEPRVVQARTGGTFGTSTFKDPEERGTKSVLRVVDGDTIILGGLLRTDITEINTSIPVLSKIPFLGRAFKHKDKSESQRELVIFITPHIVKEEFLSTSANFQQRRLNNEQLLSPKRLNAIDKELSFIEQQEF